MVLDDARLTPAHTKYDGANYHPMSRWVLFGHHFAAIAGAGPLVGPVLAAQFGYAPGLMWLVGGCVLCGAVHDSMCLWASTRMRRPVACGNRAVTNRAGRRNHGRRRDPVHSHRRPRRAWNRGRQRAGRKRVEHVHDRHDHPDRRRDGLPHVRVPQGQDSRSDDSRHHRDFRRGHLRPDVRGIVTTATTS